MTTIVKMPTLHYYSAEIGIGRIYSVWLQRNRPDSEISQKASKFVLFQKNCPGCHILKLNKFAFSQCLNDSERDRIQNELI